MAYRIAIFAEIFVTGSLTYWVRLLKEKVVSVAWRRLEFNV